MFDTSIVHSHTMAAPRRLGLFTASVAIHSAAALAAIAMGIATIEFPGDAPDQITIFRAVGEMVLPPPLGPGGPPRPLKETPKPALTPPEQQPATPEEALVTAEVPVETAAVGAATTDGGTNDSEIGGGGGGDPLGVEGGLGSDPAVIVGSGGQDGPRIPGGEVRAARVRRRVEPRYPQAMIPVRIKVAVVTVRCIIDRQGRVRDPEVLTSSWPAFNQAVLEAVEDWTFAPGTLRGEPIDTWFELTVTFRVR